MKPRSWSLAVTLGVLAALDALLPRFLNPYFMRVLMLCGINVVLAVSLNLINGFTGQFSIGHAGFMAIGAYSSAMFSMHIGVRLGARARRRRPAARGWRRRLRAAGRADRWAASLAAVAGYLVGLPSLRLRGDYLAIVTLGFGEIIRVIITNVDAVGAARGLPGIPALGELLLGGGRR